MAEIKFSCPQCSQHIQCDDQWGGLQIACPGCQTNIVVPQAMGNTPVAAPPNPILSATPRAMGTSEPKASSGKIFAIAAAAIVICGGAVFLFTHADSWQGKLDAKAKDVEAKSGGGEMGHIAKLYQVLDETDPTKREKEQLRAIREADRLAALPRPNAVASNAVAALPLLPADWTLDLAAATIPNGRVNGKISGADFVADSAKVISGAANQVLTIRQGTNAVAEREISIYLRLPTAPDLAGHTWSISKDMKVGTVPTIVKRWLVDPKFAPKEKSYGLNYVMKLEFGEEVEGLLPGKIYLALPDDEKSVIAGAFIAALPKPVLNLKAGDFRLDR